MPPPPPPKKVFGRVYCLSRNCFFLVPFSKSLSYLSGCWVYNKCCKSLDLKPLGENQNLACMKKMEAFYKWSIRFHKLMLKGKTIEKTLWWALEEEFEKRNLPRLQGSWATQKRN